MNAATLPRFSILIVNYNGAHFLADCLNSLQEQTFPADQFEVLIVDNASQDHSRTVLQQFPQYRIFAESQNWGFAAGNIVASRQALGQYQVLLNSDTIADPYWLEELARACEENPGCIIASKLILAEEPSRLNSAGLFLLRDGRGADRGFREWDDGRYEGGGLIFSGCGAALAIPIAPGEVVPLDPRYFLYCEDLEMCWAAWKRGVPTVFAPRAVVQHRVGASTNHHSPLYWYYSERNRTWTVLRHGDMALTLITLLGILARTVIFGIGALWQHHSSKYNRANFFALVKACRDVLLALPRLLQERYDSQYIKR